MTTTKTDPGFPMTHEERLEHLLSTIVIQNANIMGLLCTQISQQPDAESLGAALLKTSLAQREIAKLAIAMVNIGTQKEGEEAARRYKDAVEAEAARKPVGFGT